MDYAKDTCIADFGRIHGHNSARIAVATDVTCVVGRGVIFDGPEAESVARNITSVLPLEAAARKRAIWIAECAVARVHMQALRCGVRTPNPRG